MSASAEPPSGGPTFGICGLGNVGAAIASRLAAAGSVIAFDINSDLLGSAATELGLRAATDVDALSDASVIVLSLPNPAASREVIDALRPMLGPGHLIVETSTVNANDIQVEREMVTGSGARLVDAAVIGGVQAMYDGRALLLIGGDEPSLAAAAPTLDAISSQQMVLGPLGSGMAAKVINNAVSHAVMVVLVEAFSLGAASGVAPDLLVELLKRPDAGLIRPLTHRIAERVLNGDYAGGMTLQAARKDSMLALELGQHAGVPLFAIQAAHTVYEIAMHEGLAREDYAVIATLWEAWLDRRLTGPTT